MTNAIAPPVELAQLQEMWQRRVIPAVQERSMPVATLLRDAHPVALEGETLILEVAALAFHRRRLENHKNLTHIQVALYEITGRKFTVTISPDRHKKSDRRENKAARQERRSEIIYRWDRRVANHNCASEIDQGSDIVGAILKWSNCAPTEDLIEYVPPEFLKHVLRHALRIIQLKEMRYEEYLATDEWRHLAQLTKNKYNGRCALDVTHSADHAHHRTYQRRGREYLQDLIPLCSDCHAKFHGKHG